MLMDGEHLETFRSTSTTNGRRLEVTRPELDVTFEVFDSRFERQDLKLDCLEFYSTPHTNAEIRDGPLEK